ncbi:MAG TPA: hypothetical protein VEC06_03385 [Paucimonas sp.]|nr:hypothetical protein [Paucimonas sp.]
MEQTGSGNQASGSAEMRSGADQGVAGASGAARETEDRTAGSVRPTVDRLAGSAHQAVDKVTSFASSAAETWGQRRAQLNTVGAELVENARTYVRANPIAAVGIAAVAGFVLSRVLRSR